MSKIDFCILIPAVKKDVAFVDDLVKKLGGITLVERSINTAKSIVSSDRIFVVTDSEEISLICERQRVNFYKNPLLKLKTKEFLQHLKYFLKKKIVPVFEQIILLWPYTPLLSREDVINAFEVFKNSGKDLLVSIRRLNGVIYSGIPVDNEAFISGESDRDWFIQARSILIISTAEKTLFSRLARLTTVPFELDSNCIEIRSYQDWWICEKLLARKRIIFNVIGNKEVGMGHIFRCLAVAHEISAHEIVFVCDVKSDVAIKHLSSYNYRLEVVEEEKLAERIVSLRPDLVVNDTLDTERNFILRLKSFGIKTVSFEDLGSGAEETDLTINDLYDQEQHPLLQGNIEWGPQNFFLRDEFNNAKIHKTFARKVKAILLAFGGTDSNNLTFKIFKKIYPYCVKNGIFVYVVSGSGYQYIEEFQRYLATLKPGNFEFVFCTGIMSKIMEKVQLGISSNGRTVYELGHMGIPGIVVSHHERENLHRFSSFENGFVNIGVFKSPETEEHVAVELRKLVEDDKLRTLLFHNTQKHDFSMNKTKVVEKIERLFQL